MHGRACVQDEARRKGRFDVDHTAATEVNDAAYLSAPPADGSLPFFGPMRKLLRTGGRPVRR